MTTFSGNRALDIEEPLIFEFGNIDQSGVDFPALELDESVYKDRLGGLKRKSVLNLAGLSEPEVNRHYVRLSRKNYSIESGVFSLGSCTMKHNPRSNEQVARLSGFADLHPLQPVSTTSGMIELYQEFCRWLLKLTGMAAVGFTPRAGAQGELCGLLAIKKYFANKGDKKRTKIIVPSSSHGTNPATAAMLGYKVITIPNIGRSITLVEHIAEFIDSETAAVMLTNPNTTGAFEPDICKIGKMVHEAGGFMYCDGANFNAIAGKVDISKLNIDVMHINLHKTFSTPHGGGGPGAGPVVFAQSLKDYVPVPYFKGTDSMELTEVGNETTQGRLSAFHGQAMVFARALSYMISLGGAGIRQASEDAVLNANYVRSQLEDVISVAFPGRRSMHEVLFDDKFLEGTNITTLDFAKAMIDEGYHPMTVYFPLIVSGAMLVEPTESESKLSLDQFISCLRNLVFKAKAGKTNEFHNAPIYSPRRRVDEVEAARNPILRWYPKSV